MLFSLSEHLMFTVQALPATLVFATLIAFPLFFNSSIQTIADRAASSIRRRAPPEPDGLGPETEAAFVARISYMNRWLTILRALAIMLGVVVIALSFHAHLATGIVLGVALVIGYFLFTGRDLKMAPIIAAVAIFGFGTAMAFGSDYSRMTLNNERNVVEVKIRQVSKKVVMVRSGDRGVLFYEPETGRFSVDKWDVIENLNWERAPLYRMLFKVGAKSQ